MKVLVIEDDAMTSELLQLRLAPLGCNAVFAADAASAMELAESHKPDLIVADLHLNTGISEGFKLIQTLRQSPSTAKTPIFIHSVYIASPDDMPEVQAWADGFLPKPLRLSDLKKLIDDVAKQVPLAP